MWIKIIGVLTLGLVLAFLFVFFAVKYGWTNTAGVVDQSFPYHHFRFHFPLAPAWAEGEEWQTLKEAIVKDESALKLAAVTAQVSPRLIVALIVPEQLRLFHDEREIFKKIFSPLKILGSQTQFSWGIAGLKPETAKQIEINLPDEYRHLLDFTTADPDRERFARITDEHDHYWSYLYTALYVQEIIAEWQKAGFDISKRPEIIATLFNIGFANSHPNQNPQVGGAEILLGNEKYSFGRLAYEFYYSSELGEEFPR